jgi:hypothetical protein
VPRLLRMPQGLHDLDIRLTSLVPLVTPLWRALLQGAPALRSMAVSVSIPRRDEEDFDGQHVDALAHFSALTYASFGLDSGASAILVASLSCVTSPASRQIVRHLMASV